MLYGYLDGEQSALGATRAVVSLKMYPANLVQYRKAAGAFRSVTPAPGSLFNIRTLFLPVVRVNEVQAVQPVPMIYTKEAKPRRSPTG